MASDTEIIDCLRLINSENVGPVTFYKLVKEYGSIPAALEALPSALKIQPCSKADAEAEFERARNLGVKIITYHDNEYPALLKQLNDKPPLFYVLGNAGLLNLPLSISIVGARNATVSGRKTASKIAHDLTNNKILVISGMARGIDSAAHKGAMYACNQQGRRSPFSEPESMCLTRKKTHLFTAKLPNKAPSSRNSRSERCPSRPTFRAATGLSPDCLAVPWSLKPR